MHKFHSGGALIVLGLAVAWKSLDYRIGSLARMGPGYFPLLLGISLVVIGLLIVILPEVRSIERSGAKERNWRETFRKKLRPWVAIMSGFAAFVAFGKYGGLVPATFATVLISALGDRGNSIASCLGLASGVTVFSVIVFHHLMNLQFPLFGWG